MWYLGAVIVVGATGASAYQALLRLHAATSATSAAPAAVAQADALPPAVEITTPAPAPAQTASLPKLRPPLATASKALPVHRKRVVVAHTPPHRPTAVASAPREIPPDSPWAYPPPPPPPPPPGYGHYAYPARYPYPGYYPYYPRYGYYRSF
jgi:hypothetical protein